MKRRQKKKNGYEEYLPKRTSTTRVSLQPRFIRARRWHSRCSGQSKSEYARNSKKDDEDDDDEEEDEEGGREHVQASAVRLPQQVGR